MSAGISGAVLLAGSFTFFLECCGFIGGLCPAVYVHMKMGLFEAAPDRVREFCNIYAHTRRVTPNRRLSHSRHIMPLCLLSRRVQDSASPNFGPCFRLSKSMIALLFDSVLLQSTCSTSQPRQQKGVLGQPPQPLCPKAKQSLSHAVVSGHGLNDPFTTGQEKQRPRHLSEALKTHHLPSAGSPDHSFHSTNSFSDDRL